MCVCVCVCVYKKTYYCLIQQRYLDAAAANKARYVEELADFATMKGPPEKKPKGALRWNHRRPNDVAYSLRPHAVALDQAEELPAKQTEVSI